MDQQNVLQSLRELKRTMTYTKLANMLGTSERQVIRWITGKHQISAAWLALIRDKLA